MSGYNICATTKKFIYLEGLNSSQGVFISKSQLPSKNTINQMCPYIWTMVPYIQILFMLLPKNTYTQVAWVLTRNPHFYITIAYH